MPRSSDASGSLQLHLTLRWSTANPIKKGTSDELVFGNLPDGPGVYRIQCQMPGRPMRVYIGQAGNLKTRIDNYGRAYKTVGGGRVSPNRGINRRLRNVLRRQGTAQIQIATEAKVSVGAGRARKVVMAKEFHRLLTEAVAIVYEQLHGSALVINAAAPDVIVKFASAPAGPEARTGRRE